MKILICEPEPGGHHLRFVQSIGEEALRRGHAPVLATTLRASSHPAYAEMRAALPLQAMPEVRMRDPLISFLPRFSKSQLILRQWRMWLSFRERFSGLAPADRPDFVLAAYFDDLELATAAFGSPFGNAPWGGIVMRTRFHHSTVNPATPAVRLRGLRRMAFERNQRIPTLKSMITIDETLTEYYSRNPESAPRIRFVAEPAGLDFTLPKDEARHRLGIPADGTYVLLYGQIDMRKGVAELVAALSALPADLNAKLLVVGPQSEESRGFLAHGGAGLRAAGRIFEIDRYASTTDESLAFSAADIVWLGYSAHHGPSSVQGKASAAGRPIIACEEGNIGWTTRRYETGVIVNVHDGAAVLTALRRMVSGGPELWAGYEGACARYREGRGPEDFGRNVIRAIEESQLA